MCIGHEAVPCSIKESLQKKAAKHKICGPRVCCKDLRSLPTMQQDSVYPPWIAAAQSRQTGIIHTAAITASIATNYCRHFQQVGLNFFIFIHSIYVFYGAAIKTS